MIFLHRPSNLDPGSTNFPFLHPDLYELYNFCSIFKQFHQQPNWNKDVLGHGNALPYGNCDLKFHLCHIFFCICQGYAIASLLCIFLCAKSNPLGRSLRKSPLSSMSITSCTERMERISLWIKCLSKSGQIFIVIVTSK